MSKEKRGDESETQNSVVSSASLGHVIVISQCLNNRSNRTTAG
jgi:hypothetical protein